MEVYVEEAVTEEEALRKIYKKYGTSVNILRKHVKLVRYFFGLREKEICSVSFTLEDSKKSKKDWVANENKNYEKNAALIEAHAKRIQMGSNAKEIREDDGDRRNSKGENIAAAKGNEVDVNSEFGEKLKEIVQDLASKIQAGKKEEHKNLEKIKDILSDGDFSKEYIDLMIKRIKNELTLAELEDFSHLCRCVLDYIADSIEVKPFTPLAQKKIIAFVGPTGVGKTTSLAKIAALHFVYIQKTKDARPVVQVITTDGYKIGGVEHIKKYCTCMGLNLTITDSVQSLRACVDLNKDKTDLMFVDSSGRSPNDKLEISKLEKYLNSIDKDILEVHLVVNAGLKMKDIALTMEKYKGCNYDYVIISKLDETQDVGNVISVLASSKVPISYVMVGQEVPTDITFEARQVLLEKIKGFEGEKEYIKENYQNEYERFGDNLWLTRQKS